MKALFNKLSSKYWTKENRAYAFWGLLATAISIGVYYLLIYYYHGIIEELANAIALLIAIIFAYITNKAFVFHTKCPSFKALMLECWSFVSLRIATAVMEELLLSFLIRAVHVNEYLAKILACAIVFIINYKLSKRLIFKNKVRNH